MINHICRKVNNKAFCYDCGKPMVIRVVRVWRLVKVRKWVRK